MQRPHSALALTGATALAVLVGLGIPAAAGAASGPTTGHAVPGGTPVYVQTNDPTGNQIITYAPDANGSLVEVGHHSTGGDGYGLQGAAADQLASQGSLVYDRANGDLVAVNAGSNTIAVFTTVGGRIDGRTVLPSGGTIPVSVTVHGNDLFVLNAGGAGSVQGYFLSTLTPIPGSARSLGLTPGLTPQFLNTPGQIGFTPSGTQLVVTTKLNGSDIDVFNVTSGGALSAPVVNAAANPVPFGFVFDAAGQLVVTEAGASALTTYDIAADGTTTEVSSTTDGLKALCWVTSAGHRFVYGANAGSNDVTGYTVDPSGAATVVSNTTTDAGPIDLAATPNGSALYVETGGSDLVDSFLVQPNGSLVSTGSVAPELPGHAGLEGIAVA